MPRITRISGSLATVLVAYWAYALMAVPWIEPPAAPPPTNGTAGGDGKNDIPDLLTLEMQQIKSLFQPGDWEVKSPRTKVLVSDRAKLLFQDYTNLGEGKVEIKPCTIVFMYEGDADNEAQRIRQSIILQSPAGAILQFDRALDLKQPREANLEGGQLVGDILIRSDWKQPGPDDDLRIVTKNIRLTKQTISTSERVDFRWGPHFGSGQDMEIKLLPGKTRAAGMDVGGIESFALRRVDRLHFVLGKETEKLPGSTSKNRPEAGSAASALLSPNTPVEIGCSGPFQFDVLHHVATFRDNVRVVKLNPVGSEKGTGPIFRNGPEDASHKLDLSPFPAAGEPDQIACDLLSLWFIERPKEAQKSPAARTAKTAGSLDLTPERFEAIGNPVVVTAPSSRVTASAQRIEYNLLSKSITLDGDRPVFLQRGPSEIHARSLFYQAEEDEERLGQLTAQGPGWLRGQSPDRPGQPLEAVWRDQLRIQPRQQYKEISLTGGAELKSPGVGQLQAKNIFLWLTETPSAKDVKKFDLQPHGLLASEGVHFGSSRLSGKNMDQLEVWFEKAVGSGNSTAGNNSSAAASSQRTEGMGGLSPLGPSNAVTSDGSVQRLPPTAQRHFEVAGRRLRARVLYGTADPALTDLTIEDDVELRETQTAQPGQQPVLIRGSRLEVVKANGPDAVATIAGQPARFEGQGMGLTGSTIKLDSGTNHLTLDGPGQMDITITEDFQGKPLPAPCKLTVDWRRRMDFDGRTARFEQSVVATTPGMPSQTEITDYRLQTNIMEVQLLQPISFSDSKLRDKPKVEEVRCQGGVEVDSHSFDARRQLVSHDKMQVTDLAVRLFTGVMNGGRGWINTVRYVSDDMLPGQPVAPTDNAPAKADQLRCLHVTFQKSITGNLGNLWRREMTFRDQVRATFAPVDNWDAMLTTNDPSRLGPKGVVARCDELRVVQMLPPFGGRPAIELDAFGNAQVEGAEYKALGSRITYAQAKEVLIIQGDGRIPADLFQQKQVGAAKKQFTAQKIRYFLKTKNVEVDGAQMLEVQLPGGNEKK